LRRTALERRALEKLYGQRHFGLMQFVDARGKGRHLDDPREIEGWGDKPKAADRGGRDLRNRSAARAASARIVI
jgi:hypothetical protein